MKSIPVSVRSLDAAQSKPVVGSISVSGYSDVAFVPELGRPIWVVAKGPFQGNVYLVRSIDNGTTKQGIQVSADGSPICQIIGTLDEQGRCFCGLIETSIRAKYYLKVDRTSGTLSYEIHQ